MHISQSPGYVKDEALGRLLCELEIAGGIISLNLRLRFVLLSDASLLDCNSTLPVRETREEEGQYETSS